MVPDLSPASDSREDGLLELWRPYPHRAPPLLRELRPRSEETASSRPLRATRM